MYFSSALNAYNVYCTLHIAHTLENMNIIALRHEYRHEYTKVYNQITLTPCYRVFSLSNKPIFKVSGLTGFELLKVNSYVTAGSFYAFKNNNDIFSTCLYVWTDMVK